MLRETTQTDAGVATTGLEPGADLRWQARRGLAGAIRLLALGGPVAASVAVVYGASRLVSPPPGSTVLFIAWWAALSVAGTLSLVGVARLCRRLLPLATLMRLSLVFPDGAPSRFRTALRSGTVTTLEQRLAHARQGAPDRTPVEAAQLLLELVAHLDEHDPLTRGHSERVRAYAQSIGRELGLDPRELDLLNWAALLHDVGKLDVPHEILAKSGRPTEEEWDVLRRHPSAGTELAAPLRPWLGEWSAAIEQHHERWDGTGYPRGLAGEEISLAGRIVAVADVFDVITSSRSYKQPGSIAEARKELARCAGAQLDPDVVRAFLALSVRQGRIAAPLAWLAHATVLFRLPAVPASGLPAGAAAVAVGAGLGLGVPVHSTDHATPAAPSVRSAQPAPAATRPPVPSPPPRPAATSAVTKEKARAANAGHRRGPVEGSRTRPAPEPRNVEPEAPSPRPTASPPASTSSSAVSKPANPLSQPAPAGRATVPELPEAPSQASLPSLDPPPAAVAGSLVEDVTSVADDLSAGLPEAVDVTPPAGGLPDALGAVVDDVTSLLTPPAQGPAPSPDDDQQGSDDSLLDGVGSLLAAEQARRAVSGP